MEDESKTETTIAKHKQKLEKTMVAISGVKNVKEYVHNMGFEASLKKVYHLYSTQIYYNRFLKIIKLSGEEISGQVTGFTYLYLGIRSPVYYSSDLSKLKTSSHWIPLDSIKTITPLDDSYAPQLAHNWIHKPSGDGMWLVEIIHYRKPHKLVGKLIQACEEYESDYIHPITFSIQTDPNNSCYDHIGIADIISIRKLPYTSKSILPLKQDRIINTISILEKTTLMADVLISIVIDYLAQDILDDLPQNWHDYLVAKASNQKRKREEVLSS